MRETLRRTKIGPGVYAIGPLGEIEMEPEVVARRLSLGLPVPQTALIPKTAARIEEVADAQPTVA